MRCRDRLADAVGGSRRCAPTRRSTRASTNRTSLLHRRRRAPARRAGDGHRRDVADRRGRARRRRQRARSVAAFRPGDRDDTTHHGVDQPRFGRTARRACRAHRAGSRLSAVVEDRARQPAGSSRAEIGARRSDRPGARGGGVGHADRALAFPIHRRSGRGRKALALLRTLGAIGEDGGSPHRTADGRATAPPAPRSHRGETPSSTACVVAALVDERDVLRGRVGDLPADLAFASALVAGHVGDERADRRTLRRLAERAEDLARRAGIQFDVGAIEPDLTGRLCSPGSRTGWRATTAGSVPDAHRNDGVAGGRRSAVTSRVRRSRRSRWTAGRRADPARGGDRRRRSRHAARRCRRARRLTWDRDRDDLVLRIERRLDALALGEEVHVPTPGDDTVDALVDRVRATKLAVLTWSSAAEQVRARVAFLRREGGGEASPWPDPRTRRCSPPSTHGCGRT